jgi:hypothetical protein
MVGGRVHGQLPILNGWWQGSWLVANTQWLVAEFMVSRQYSSTVLSLDPNAVAPSSTNVPASKRAPYIKVGALVHGV